MLIGSCGIPSVLLTLIKENLPSKNLDNYNKSQVKPPTLDYFDHDHMKEIKNFVQTYFDSNEGEQNVPLEVIDFDICNAPITSDQIEIHIKKT